jgi:hypothetical protein
MLAYNFGPAGDGPGWKRAVLAQGDEAALIDMDADPVAVALNRMELLRTSPDDCLDGIGYSVRVETNTLSGQFRFANPNTPALIGLEAAALELAERAVQASGGHLARVVEVWRQYVWSPPGEPLELRFED